MATSTEKQDFVGRAVAQVRDNARNDRKKGILDSMQYELILLHLDEVKRRVRKFEDDEKQAWLQFLSSYDPPEDDWDAAA